MNKFVCLWKVRMVDVTGGRMDVELHSFLTAALG
jgi:hypothetical protein